MSEREDDEARIVDRRASTLPDRGEAANDPPAQDAEALTRQLAEETEKAQAYLANWQRAAADYQNYKRRVEQEREEMARLASAALIINILPILDDLERALQSVDAHLAGLTWVDGIRLIYRKFQAVLEMNGVNEIEADGKDFDPNYHEAVAFAQGEEGKVLSVVQKGYMLNNRVLRPSMVVVGKAGAPAG
jgi:molecular chaperone GrpE